MPCCSSPTMRTWLPHKRCTCIWDTLIESIFFETGTQNAAHLVKKNSQWQLENSISVLFHHHQKRTRQSSPEKWRFSLENRSKGERQESNASAPSSWNQSALTHSLSPNLSSPHIFLLDLYTAPIVLLLTYLPGCLSCSCLLTVFLHCTCSPRAWRFFPSASTENFSWHIASHILLKQLAQRNSLLLPVSRCTAILWSGISLSLHGLAFIWISGNKHCVCGWQWAPRPNP